MKDIEVFTIVKHPRLEPFTKVVRFENYKDVVEEMERERMDLLKEVIELREWKRRRL